MYLPVLYFLTFFLYWSNLINNVALASSVQQVIQLYMYLFFFQIFSHLGYYRIVSRVPCVVQYVLVGYLF